MPGFLSTLGPATLHIPSSWRGTVGADKQGESTISLKEQLGRYRHQQSQSQDGAEPPPQLQFSINR